MTNQQVKQYLQRLDYSRPVTVDLSTLKLLQIQHLYNVPFENLDIHYDSPITLDIDRIFEKVILNKRGGFCYELNGIFYELLHTIGFEVRRLAARVFNATKQEYGIEFDHLVNMVQIGKYQYLVDVGFGEFSLRPLPILLQKEIRDHRGTFRIVNHNLDIFRVEKRNKDKWEPEYIFTDQACHYQDFEQACQYHQTSSESNFTKKKVCSIATPEGRITLNGDKLKIRHGEREEITPIVDEAEFLKHLKEQFGIVL